MSDFKIRLDNLYNGLKTALKAMPVTVSKGDTAVEINFQELPVCEVIVEEETFRINKVSEEWSNSTNYRCNKSENGTWYYYVETIDECIGEVKRLFVFEAQKDKTKKPRTGVHNSELSRVLTLEKFEKAFAHLMEQADENMKTGKANGTKTLFGFDKIPVCDGANALYHYGQGGAGKTPYMNWWVVSIYYLVKEQRIVLGIEDDRYAHINEMKPVRYTRFSNRNNHIAVFYETTVKSLDYSELYEHFISVSEEVMRLGME